MFLRPIIHKLAEHPRKLFLIDGFGALLSAFLLGIVLPSLGSIIGLPIKVLYFLASIPIFFAFYDFYCHFRTPKNWKPYLKAIAYANVIYCMLSIGMVMQHYSELTNFGITYFILEIIVVLILVYIELKIIANS